MQYEDRVPEELFRADGHYLGRPADMDDRIIKRRVDIVKGIDGFCDPSLDLLEIGCGNGASLFHLSKHFKNCVGIEVNDDHLSVFDQYVAAHDIDNCTYQIADVLTSRPTRAYDRVISFEVIEHITDEDRGMKYFYDAVVPGGLVAITVPNKWWIFETHGARLPLLPWNRVPFFSWLPTPLHERWAHARIYTKSRIQRLFTKHGFEVLDTSYVTAPMDVLSEGRLKRWLTTHIFKHDTTSIGIKATSVFLLARKPL